LTRLEVAQHPFGKLFALGCAVAWMPPAEFVAYITDETRKWSQLIPAMGISIEE
jgi:tripartite-type tricarboxylate transporter receptor subunit TctC